MSSSGSPVREMRDHYGRRYRVGEQPRELIGHSRSWMLWLCWAPMLAVGVLQYGYGAAIPAMTGARGWSATGLLWLLAGWTVFQAGAGFPAAHLRQRDRIGPRTVLLLGAGLCLVGVLTLAYGQSAPTLVTGFSVLGGTGAGLVYAACTSTTAKWYPERSASRVSFVTGGFAYGSVPFVIAVVVGVGPGNLPAALTGFAVLLFVVVFGCGLLVTDPPRNWWPPHIDPRQWALSRELNPGQAKNPPAAKEYSASEALRTTALPVMYTCLFCAGTVSLFNAAFLVLLGTHLGIGAWPTAAAAAAFAGANGAGRALAIYVSDHVGRRRTLTWVMGIQAVAQFFLLTAAAGGSGALLGLGTALAGLGGGAFYPLFASLAREYFGERSSAEVHGVVYSAKAFSGVVGVGLAAVAVAQWGYAPVFVFAGCLSLCSVVLSSALRRPGIPNTLPSPRPASP